MYPTIVSKKKWIDRPHGILFAIILLIGAFSLTVVLGTGISQIIYFAIALVAAVVSEQFTRRSKTPLRVHLITVLLTLVPIGVMCYRSARPGPDVLFKKVFDIAPPAGVSNFQGRLQWYDGQTTLMRFHADEQAIKAILSSKPFSLDDRMESRRAEGVDMHEYIRLFFNLSFIADSQWIHTVTFKEAQFWKCENFHKPSGGFDATNILINENGDVWVMHNSG